MAVITNLNTRQDPVVSGLSGTQVIKFVHADRVYIKAVDSTPTPVVVKSGGTLPSGWTDLGIINGAVKVAYTKNVVEVRTGLDQILRQTYDDKKTGSFTFQLSQFDDNAMANLTGISASQIVNGSIYQFAVGSESTIQRAVLLVSENKLDGKEWQFYHPNAFITFDITDASGETVLAATCNLPLFPWGGGTNQALFVQSIFV